MENNFCAEQATNCTNSTTTKNVCIKEENNMDNNLIQQGTGSTDSIKAHNNEGKAFGFRAEPARNLMDAYSNKEGSIIDGIISQGLTVLSGRNGPDISSLALNMALCISGEEDFLGRETKHGNAIYISTGEPRERIHAMLDGPAPENLDVSCQAGCNWAELHEFLNTYLHGHPGTKAAIIDMAGISKAPKNGRKDGYAHAYAGTKALKELADKHGAAIILITQCRMSRDKNDWVDGIGGVGVTEAPDTILKLKKNGIKDLKMILPITGRGMADRRLAVRLDVYRP